MKTFLFFIFCPLVCLVAQEQRVITNPLFVFNNAFVKQGVTAMTKERQAEVLKEWGFDGIEAKETEGLTEYVSVMKKAGLKVFANYLRIDIEKEEPFLPSWKEVMPELDGTGMILWVHIHSEKYKPSDEAADDKTVGILRELADLARPHGVKVAIYPHYDFLAETTEDALRLVRKANRENLGIAFNLCHFLRTMPEERIAEQIDLVFPKMFAVSICGADGGDTQAMGWDRLIQPLGQGGFNTYQVVEYLIDKGYKGPFGLQCYALKGEPSAYLPQSGAAWREMKKRYAESPNVLSHKEITDGWELLFDGKNTALWRGVNRESFPAAGWRIAENSLIADVSGGNESADVGDIITKKKYGKFILKWEWNMKTKGGNSGLKYYVQEGIGNNKGYGFGLEYQLLDDKYHEWMLSGKMKPNDFHTLGALYELYPASPDKYPNPLCLWNESMIVSDGAKVEHWLNGKCILKYDRTTDDFKQKIAASKFKNVENYGIIPEGHLLLQDHGSKIYYRNIKIKELK